MVQFHYRPNVADIRAMKARGEKISMLYVTTLEEAAAADAAGIHMLSIESRFFSPEMRAAAREAKLPEALLNNFKLVPQRGAVKYLYVTGIGPGAHLLPPSASLADAQGMPIYTKAEAKEQKTSSLHASVALGAAVAVAVVAAIVAMRAR
jgi:hypothetical protein